MKKALIAIAVIFAILFSAMFIIPIVFRDDIKAAIDKELDGAVNAKIYYDPDKLNLTFFKNFPNLTIALGEFGVAGIGVFESDTLVDVQSFDITINVMSLFGDKISIKAITLDNPSIELLVLSDGKANWDIAIADTAAVEEETPEEPSAFAISIEKWEIKNGNILYSDLSAKMFADVRNLNHTGKGDITATLYDLVTKTTIESLTFEMEGIKYLNKVAMEANATLQMDMAHSKYTFKENTFRLNDFILGFDGSIAMPEDGSMVFDLTFGAKETQFKNILSLVPGVFMEGFEKMKTDGSLAFDGFYRGVMRDSTQSPGFGLNLKVADGMFQYPDLPTAVSNIQVDLSAGTPDGDMEKLSIDFRKFHLDMGSNPVDMTLKSQGLSVMNLDANVKANLNLGEIIQMFPMEGLTLKGVFSMDANAKGVYSEKQMPALKANMSLANGYVKSAEFPAPLEELSMMVIAENATGEMKDMKVNVSQFHMKLENEPLDATLKLENFDNYTWDLTANGGIDLGKIMKIFPQEGMALEGYINADLRTQGQLSDVEAERYDKLPTSGNMEVKNLVFVSADMPHTFKLSGAAMNFDPMKIEISKFSGFIGHSDINVKGYVTNYMAFIFKPGEVVKGKMDFYSKSFDVNEWMTDDTTTVAAPASEVVADPASVPLHALEVPRNIDFELNSKIDKVIYSNMDISNLAGTITVKEGVVRMKNTAFNTLGGGITLNGAYDARDINFPKFDFSLLIKDMAIAKTYETFNAIQAMAPAAKGMKGNFSTDFKIKGYLLQDMSPDYATLTGGGVVLLKEASVSDLKLLNVISEVTKTESYKTINLKDVTIQAEIKDGRVYVKPFDMQAGTQKLTISGSNGFDNTIDYDILMPNVKTGAAGAAINAAVSGFFGGQNLVSDAIDITLKAIGSASDPKVRIASVKPSGGGAGTKSVVNDQLNKAKEEVEQKIKAEQEKLKKEAEDRAKAEQERLKKETEDKLKKELEDSKNKLKDRFKLK